MSNEAAASDRVISFGPGLAAIPERLLLAHAKGEVLFICGAGISRPAGLPDFRDLVLDVYERVDTAVHDALSKLPREACNRWEFVHPDLTERQHAEVRRFIAGDYDVVLGMLERRLDDQTRGDSRVRQEIDGILRKANLRPASIHRTLMRLADRGGATTIVTTNFDRLLQAAKPSCERIETYSLGEIPRPTRRSEFSGVLHIHGALYQDTRRFAELVVTDRDFGEFYLRRRLVPDFIYDAARLFHLVLVGYSANDPPMRYLLNAVAADGTRFDDVKERFTFYGTSSEDPAALEDWKARGITPIRYDASVNHEPLYTTFAKWADFSAHNGKQATVDKAIKTIVRDPRSASSDQNRDLFDHLIRRSNPSERIRLSSIASKASADFEWLNAIIEIGHGNDRNRKI